MLVEKVPGMAEYLQSLTMGMDLILKVPAVDTHPTFLTPFPDSCS